MGKQYNKCKKKSYGTKSQVVLNSVVDCTRRVYMLHCKPGLVKQFTLGQAIYVISHTLPRILRHCLRSFNFSSFLQSIWHLICTDWSKETGVQLLVFFCSSVPVVLFDTPGISRCRSQHISVESSSLLHHRIYLWFICYTWWSIDELENLHADRTTVCFEPW